MLRKNSKLSTNLKPMWIKLFKTFLKFTFVLFVSLFFVAILYFILQKTGIIGKFNNIHELKTLILSAGFWAYGVFVVLQFLQVTILPLPASVTTIVGVILFGPFKTFFLSTLAILLGSVFAYFLGKIFGIKLLNWIFGKEKTLQLQEKIKKGKFIFFIMMLFPFFPDDILCMLSGVINMDFKFFLYTNLITRPIGLFCLCFLGGSLQNFSLWQILISFTIILLVIIFIVFLIKKKKYLLFTNTFFKNLLNKP